MAGSQMGIGGNLQVAGKARQGRQKNAMPCQPSPLVRPEQGAVSTATAGCGIVHAEEGARSHFAHPDVEYTYLDCRQAPAHLDTPRSLPHRAQLVCQVAPMLLCPRLPLPLCATAPRQQPTSQHLSRTWGCQSLAALPTAPVACMMRPPTHTKPRQQHQQVCAVLRKSAGRLNGRAAKVCAQWADLLEALLLPDSTTPPSVLKRTATATRSRACNTLSSHLLLPDSTPEAMPPSSVLLEAANSLTCCQLAAQMMQPLQQGNHNNVSAVTCCRLTARPTR